MLATPYLMASGANSSMLTLPTFTLPSYSFAIFSMVGANILHGPHQPAQKSTNTGMSDSNTSFSKLVVFNVISAILNFSFQIVLFLF